MARLNWRDDEMKKERRLSERRQQSVAVQTERRRSDRRVVTDRRKQHRLSFEMWMEEVSGDDVYFRHTGNISEGGVYFERAIPHPLGTMLTLKFNIPGQSDLVIARAEVISIPDESAGMGMGVRFVSFEEDGARRLKDFFQQKLSKNEVLD